MPEAEERRLAVVEHESFEAIELADEELIVQEIAGRVTDKFIYEMKGMRSENGEPVIGLSYAGTNWACREYAKQGECIRVVGRPEIIQDPLNPQYIVTVVTVQRVAIDPETKRETPLDSTFGIKRQWSMMKKKKYENGVCIGEEIVEDPFHFEKCLSKALRNGKQALIPTDVVKKLIMKALEVKGGRGPGRPPGSGAKQVQAAPKAPTQAPAAPQNPQPPKETPPAAPTLPVQAAPPPPTVQDAPPPKTEPSAPVQAKSPAQPATAPAAPKAQSKDTLVQKFEIVLKKAFGTTDPILARQHMKALSGTDRISDLSEEDLTKYGRILQGVFKGQNKISDDKTLIVEIASGKVLWGTPPAAPQTAPPPPPSAPPKDESFF